MRPDYARRMRNLIMRVAFAVALTLSKSAIAQSSVNLAQAEAFVAQAEKELAAFSILSGRANWVNSTYITDDTDALAAEFGARGTEMSVRLAKGAAKYDGVKGLSFDVRRKLDFLKQGIVLPAPEKPGAAEELNVIATKLQSQYGKGKGTLEGKPISGSDIEEAMGRLRDPEKLKEMWVKIGRAHV